MSSIKSINFNVDNFSEVLKKLPSHLKLKALRILKKELKESSGLSNENEDTSESFSPKNETPRKVKKCNRRDTNPIDEITSPNQTIHLEVVSETNDIENIIQQASNRRASKRHRKRNSSFDDFLTSYDVGDVKRRDDGAVNSVDEYNDEDGDNDDEVVISGYNKKMRKKSSKKGGNGSNNSGGGDITNYVVDDVVVKVENVTNDDVEELLVPPTTTASTMKKNTARPKKTKSLKAKRQKIDDNDGDYVDDDDDADVNDDGEEEDDDSNDVGDDGDGGDGGKKKKRKSSKMGRPKEYDDDDVLVIYDDYGAKSTVYQCKTCHKKLSSAYSLKQHMRKHNGNVYVCDYCGSKFVSSTGFKLHLLYHENDTQTEGIYKCKKCLYAVKSKKLLEEHVRNRHDPNKPRNHICDVCGKGFLVCNQLKRHLLTHAQKDVQCPLCPFQTYDQTSLERHHHNVHSHELTIFECELCGQELRSKGTYLDHIRRHVGHYRKQCDICNKPFANASQLAAHKRSHEQPTVPCEVCGKKLRNKHKLYVHMLVHTGQKDFRCPYCSYATYVSHNLKKHCMNRHAVVYPPDKMKKIKRYNPEDILKIKVLKDSIAINCVKDVQSIKEQTRQEEMENEVGGMGMGREGGEEGNDDEGGDNDGEGAGRGDDDNDEVSVRNILGDFERVKSKRDGARFDESGRTVGSTEISLRISTADTYESIAADDDDVVASKANVVKVPEGDDYNCANGYDDNIRQSTSNASLLDKCVIQIKPYLCGSSSSSDDIHRHGVKAESNVHKQYITLKKMTTSSTPLHKRIITVNILDQLKKEPPQQPPQQQAKQQQQQLLLLQQSQQQQQQVSPADEIIFIIDDVSTTATSTSPINNNNDAKNIIPSSDDNNDINDNNNNNNDNINNNNNNDSTTLKLSSSSSSAGDKIIDDVTDQGNNNGKYDDLVESVVKVTEEDLVVKVEDKHLMSLQ